MVKRIKKKIERGPKGRSAVPLVIVMTALYGSRRQGRDFRERFDSTQGVRSALRLHLDAEVIIADRPLSESEYLGWEFRSRPARLAEMFSGSGAIPMGSAADRDDEEGRPRLGILPMVALVQERALQAFSERLSEEMGEVSRVAFQNAVHPALQMIPGYDLLLYRPPCPAQGLNRAIEALNGAMRESFDQASVPFPGPLPALPAEEVRAIPLKEPCSKAV